MPVAIASVLVNNYQIVYDGGNTAKTMMTLKQRRSTPQYATKVEKKGPYFVLKVFKFRSIFHLPKT